MDPGVCEEAGELAVPERHVLAARVDGVDHLRRAVGGKGGWGLGRRRRGRQGGDDGGVAVEELGGARRPEVEPRRGARGRRRGAGGVRGGRGRTLLRLKRDVLIWQLSTILEPQLPDLRLSSLPARSMMLSLPLQVSARTGA